MRAPSRLIAAAAAVMLAVHALGTIVLASEPTAVAPEIGPGSISAGLALLAGGVMLFRARRGSK